LLRLTFSEKEIRYAVEAFQLFSCGLFVLGWCPEFFFIKSL